MTWAFWKQHWTNGLRATRESSDASGVVGVYSGPNSRLRHTFGSRFETRDRDRRRARQASAQTRVLLRVKEIAHAADGRPCAV